MTRPATVAADAREEPPTTHERFLEALAEWAGRPAEEPKTARGARTRDAIVAAARAVLEERGFVDSRVSDFVKAAGVSHGSFYNYFQNKNEVFAAVIENVVTTQMTATVVPAGFSTDPVHRIEYTVRQYVRVYRELARISVVIRQVAALDTGFRHVRLIIRHEFRERVERGLIRQQQAGLVDPTLDARITADTIVSMISGYCYNCFGVENSTDTEGAVDVLTRFWTNGLGLTGPGVDARAVATGS